MTTRSVSLPTGTVTFLFTDVEDSTGLVERLGAASDDVIERQALIVKGAVEAHGGVVVRTEGDGVFAAFAAAGAAVRAAIDAQAALAAESWSHGEPVRVRMGMHTGEGRLGGDDYLGIDVHRAARIASAAHGEQIIVSEVTRNAVTTDLPPGVSFIDLGDHGLKGLPEPVRIHQATVEGFRRTFPQLRATGGKPNNLPAELTSFVGRQADLDTIVGMLREHRLVTLTGTGGTGKTRLALRAAASASDFFGGVYFVPLAPLSQPELVAVTILAAMGMTHPVDDPAERLRSDLADKDWLLLLDNFEHVLGAAPLVSEILAAAPAVHILVTSRAPLRVAGEHEYPVSPLAIPEAGTTPTVDELETMGAVRLLVERAREVRNDFALDASMAGSVAELTRLLDGLPLALELAAAWLRLLPIEAVVERLRQREDLAGGRRDAPTRQRTLQATIGWSYDLLGPDEQRLFERLSVFAGGGDLAAVEAVGGPGDVLEPLSALVDNSLVRAVDLSGLPRFTMLETIRQYAAARLDDRGTAAEARDAHLYHFQQVASTVGADLLGEQRNQALDRLDIEIDNVRAGLAWAIESRQPDAGAALASPIWRYWHMRGSVHEGRDLLERLLAMEGWSDHARLDALEAAGGLAYWHNDHRRAEQLYAESVDVAEGLDDQSALARAVYNLSFPVMFQDRFDEALESLQRALSIYRTIDDEPGMGRVLWGIGSVEWTRSNPDAALESFHEALALHRRHDDVFMLGWNVRMIASVHLKEGRATEARPWVEEGMTLFSSVGDASGVIYHLRDFAELALIEADHERAIVLAGAVRAAVESSGVQLVDQQQNQLPDLSEARAALGPERAAALEARGRTLDLEQATAYAMSERDLDA